MSLRQTLFHGLGVGCVSSAVFLQLLVFWGIIESGVFVASERNPLVLATEFLMSVFALVYFVYVAKKMLERVKRQPSEE